MHKMQPAEVEPYHIRIATKSTIKTREQSRNNTKQHSTEHNRHNGCVIFSVAGFVVGYNSNVFLQLMCFVCFFLFFVFLETEKIHEWVHEILTRGQVRRVRFAAVVRRRPPPVPPPGE